MEIVPVKTGVLAGSFGREGVGNGQFRFPAGICMSGDGNLLVCDWGNHRVQKLSCDGVFMCMYGVGVKYPNVVACTNDVIAVGTMRLVRIVLCCMVMMV